MPAIPPSYYTLNPSPSVKTITFTAPYNTLTTSEIISIRNLSKQIEIYDSSDPRKHTSMIPVEDQTQDFDINIESEVLTYVVGAGMESGDELQIITSRQNVTISNDSLKIDDATPLSVNINGATNTSSNLFTAQTVAASATATSPTPIQTGQLSKLICYVSNAGASTNCTVDIYASPTNSTTGRRKQLATFTLGAGTAEVPYETGNGIDPKQLDNYIWGKITNGGTADAIITVEFSMFR